MSTSKLQTLNERIRFMNTLRKCGMNCQDEENRLLRKRDALVLRMKAVGAKVEAVPSPEPLR